MEKQTKSILDREKIKKDLMMNIKEEIPRVAILTFFMVIVLVIFFANMKDMFRTLFDDPYNLITLILLPLATFFYIIFTYNFFVLLYKIQANKFSVHQDNMIRKEEIIKNKLFAHVTVKVAHFKVYGQCEISKTAYTFSEVGETFFVVVSNGKKATALTAYNMKFYEFNE